MTKNLPISAFLLPIAFVFIMLSFYFPRMIAVQLGLVVAFASLYIGASLMHHHKDKSLTPQIILEYILVATLIVVIMAGISL